MNNNANSCSISFVAVATGQNVIVSYDLFISTGSSNAGRMIEFYNNSGADLCMQLDNTPANALVLRNANNAVVVTSSANILTRGAWHHVEIEAGIGSLATGDVKVWVDDVLVINQSGVDLSDGSTSGCDRIRWIEPASGGDQFQMDTGSVIISDTTGPAPWNAPLGDKRMYVLMPTSDSSVAWTPVGSGSNFGAVDDAIPAVSDGDGTYVERATGSDAIDLYGYANLPAGTVDIVGVIVDMEMRKSDAGTLPGGGSVKAQIELSALTTDSPAFTLTTTYTRYQHMFPEKPGGGAWLLADVDAATSGPFFDV
jgi:hypothetical protein